MVVRPEFALDSSSPSSPTPTSSPVPEVSLLPSGNGTNEPSPSPFLVPPDVLSILAGGGDVNSEETGQALLAYGLLMTALGRGGRSSQVFERQQTFFQQNPPLVRARQGLATTRTLISQMDEFPELKYQEDRIEGDNILNRDDEMKKEDEVKVSASSPVSTTNSPLPRHPRTFLVGQWVDCRDTAGAWLGSTILSIQDGKALIHYNEWASRWDEWIQLDSPRIAPYRSMSSHRTRSLSHVSPTPTRPQNCPQTLDDNLVKLESVLEDTMSTLNVIQQPLQDLQRRILQSRIDHEVLEEENKSLTYHEEKTDEANDINSEEKEMNEEEDEEKDIEEMKNGEDEKETDSTQGEFDPITHGSSELLKRSENMALVLDRLGRGLCEVAQSLHPQYRPENPPPSDPYRSLITPHPTDWVPSGVNPSIVNSLEPGNRRTSPATQRQQRRDIEGGPGVNGGGRNPSTNGQRNGNQLPFEIILSLLSGPRNRREDDSNNTITSSEEEEEDNRGSGGMGGRFLSGLGSSRGLQRGNTYQDNEDGFFVPRSSTPSSSNPRSIEDEEEEEDSTPFVLTFGQGRGRSPPPPSSSTPQQTGNDNNPLMTPTITEEPSSNEEMEMTLFGSDILRLLRQSERIREGLDGSDQGGNDEDESNENEQSTPPRRNSLSRFLSSSLGSSNNSSSSPNSSSTSERRRGSRIRRRSSSPSRPSLFSSSSDSIIPTTTSNSSNNNSSHNNSSNNNSTTTRDRRGSRRSDTPQESQTENAQNQQEEEEGEGGGFFESFLRRFS